MSTQLLKAALRKEMKEKLAVLTDDEIASQTQIILKKLFANEIFQNSSRVSVYLSMKQEVGTLDIIHNLFENDKQCFIPKYQVGGAVMDMVPLHSMQDYNELPMTKWKIKQPAANDIRKDALETGGLDVILAPGMAFTSNGARLGHGRGYYDAYLRRCLAGPNARKPFYIGLALKQQIVDSIPMSSSDIPVDLVITA